MAFQPDPIDGFPAAPSQGPNPTVPVKEDPEAGRTGTGRSGESEQKELAQQKREFGDLLRKIDRYEDGKKSKGTFEKLTFEDGSSVKEAFDKIQAWEKQNKRDIQTNPEFSVQLEKLRAIGEKIDIAEGKVPTEKTEKTADAKGEGQKTDQAPAFDADKAAVMAKGLDDNLATISQTKGWTVNPKNDPAQQATIDAIRYTTAEIEALPLRQLASNFPGGAAAVQAFNDKVKIPLEAVRTAQLAYENARTQKVGFIKADGSNEMIAPDVAADRQLKAAEDKLVREYLAKNDPRALELYNSDARKGSQLTYERVQDAHVIQTKTYYDLVKGAPTLQNKGFEADIEQRTQALANLKVAVEKLNADSKTSFDKSLTEKETAAYTQLVTARDNLVKVLGTPTADENGNVTYSDGAYSKLTADLSKAMESDLKMRFAWDHKRTVKVDGKEMVQLPIEGLTQEAAERFYAPSTQMYIAQRKMIISFLEKNKDAFNPEIQAAITEKRAVNRWKDMSREDKEAATIVDSVYKSFEIEGHRFNNRFHAMAVFHQDKQEKHTNADDKLVLSDGRAFKQGEIYGPVALNAEFTAHVTGKGRPSEGELLKVDPADSMREFQQALSQGKPGEKIFGKIVHELSRECDDQYALTTNQGRRRWGWTERPLVRLGNELNTRLLVNTATSFAFSFAFGGVMDMLFGGKKGGVEKIVDTVGGSNGGNNGGGGNPDNNPNF